MKAAGGCIDIPPGARVAVLTARHNTSIVNYDPGDGLGTRRFIVPNIDFATASAAALPPLEPAKTPVRLAYSARLEVEIFADRPDWCAPNISLRVMAQSGEVFQRPDLATLLQRVGAGVVARRCPAAETLAFNGSVGGAAATWHRTAAAVEHWALREVAVPSLAAGVDLDTPDATAPVASPQPAAMPPAVTPLAAAPPVFAAAPTTEASVAAAAPPLPLSPEPGLPTSPEQQVAAIQIQPCPAQYPGSDDRRETMVCTCDPASLEDGNVIGSDLYGYASVPCRAARHSGILGPQGGTAAFFPLAGDYTLSGSDRNDISSGSGRVSGAFKVRAATQVTVDFVGRLLWRDRLLAQVTGIRTDKGITLVPVAVPSPAFLDLVPTSPAAEVKVAMPGANEMTLPIPPPPLLGPP
jgi:hypothetical protein